MEKQTFEEWLLLGKALAEGPEKGKEVVIEFYKKRLKKIMESDELLSFETEKEYTLEEFIELLSVWLSKSCQK